MSTGRTGPTFPAGWFPAVLGSIALAVGAGLLWAGWRLMRLTTAEPSMRSDARPGVPLQAAPPPPGSQKTASQKTTGQSLADSPPGEGDVDGEGEGETPRGELRRPYVETPVADDGRMLWASPTQGPAADLGYLPAGVQAIAVVRWADLFVHSEGEKLRAALGPWGEETISHWTAAVGGPLEDVEWAVAACFADDQNRLRYSYRIELKRPLLESQAAERFAHAQRVERQGKGAWIVGDQVCFLPTEKHGKTLVVCPDEAADELLASQGAPLPTTPQLERLAPWIDLDRTVSLLASPDFLMASGEQMIAGSGGPLFDAWIELLQRDATAFLFSADWRENFFVELRVLTRPDVPPQRYGQLLRQRIASAPSQVQTAILSQSWPPYSRQSVGRLPLMLQTLSALTRVGVDERQAVVRAYLPIHAGHNLAQATELFLNEFYVNKGETPAMGVATDVASAPTPPNKRVALVERLARPGSLVFPKDTLERALDLLANDLQTPIEIRGEDLRLEGITKNQSFEIELRERPLGEILVQVLCRANPDRTASGPADPRQKLVYILDEGTGGDAAARIIVTTRRAAAGRGDRLPDVFSLPRE